MGYQTLQRKSQTQLARHIRTLAQDSGAVLFTQHVRVQMRRRKVSSAEVLECLRLGTLRRVPEPNPGKGSLECRMERYVAGRELAVIVALCDEAPDLVVVTVFSVG